MTDAVLYILIAMNAAAYVLMGIDKSRAIRHKRRIPERTLFAFAILFGSVGGTLGMYVFRHKTKHWYFQVFFPLLIVVHTVILGLIY